jgi:hypothetical protein
MSTLNAETFFSAFFSYHVDCFHPVQNVGLRLPFQLQAGFGLRVVGREWDDDESQEQLVSSLAEFSFQAD